LDETGKPVRIVGTVQDVTDRRRLEEQFRHSQKMEAIGQLAAGVAHDFNNLLTVIQGNASLQLESECVSEECASQAKQVVEAAERAAGLTRQLLLFSRRQIMEPTLLDLNVTVGNMTKMLQRILGEDIALQSEFAPGLPCIFGDASMIEQVILNLAVNAREAMQDGGRLVITTAPVTVSEDHRQQNPDASLGSCICLSVCDTGCGIAPEFLPHIFEPFFTTKEVGKGTGLGLATVYGIVKQHHGWIELDTEVKVGTTFRIFLPAVEGAQAEKRTIPDDIPLPEGQETILVVEDEAAVRLLVNNLLQRCGYTVLLAESGVAALEVWKKEKDRIQLLLTDMIMPDGMTGRELAARLRGERPDLKVIYTSGYSSVVVGKGLALVEGFSFVQKPYPPIRLAQTIRNCLDQSRP
jgi:nitrogen-specific signal transduction histidine kinase